MKFCVLNYLLLYRYMVIYGFLLRHIYQDLFGFLTNQKVSEGFIVMPKIFMHREFFTIR